MTKQGKAHCWGFSMAKKPTGETTGYGEDTGFFSSTPAEVLRGKTVAHISASEGLTCAVTSGGTYCWGTGIVGNGTYIEHHPNPVRISDRFVQVSTGGSLRTCGITANGTPYCWGLKTKQRSDGDTYTERHLTPKKVPRAPAFTQVRVYSTMTTCGLTPGGTVYCWGVGGPELGIGQKKTKPVRETPQRVQPPGNVQFKQLTARGPCALSTNGDVYCWGGGVDSATPVQVTDGIHFEQISGGPGYGCGITVDGTTYCWGNNSEGQLGNGTTKDSQTPVRVKGLGGEN